MQNNSYKPKMDKISGEDIVVSGMDGRFPKSRNIEEFGQNLYNKVTLRYVYNFLVFKNYFQGSHVDRRRDSMDTGGLSYVI